MGMTWAYLIISTSGPGNSPIPFGSTRTFWASKKATGRISPSPAPGCTARARRWCISSIFRRREEPQKPDSGVVHHVAFVSRGFAGMKQRLQSKGMTFDARQVPGGELWQIFVNDPNGVMIELNYEAAKEQGRGSAPPVDAGQMHIAAV